MEILDKEFELIRKLKEIKSSFGYFFGPISGIVAIFWVYLSIDSHDIATFGLSISLFFVALSIYCFTYPTRERKKLNKEIAKINNNTAKFEKFTVPTKIISKAQENTTEVYGSISNGNGDVSSSTYYNYIVGLRTTNGNLITIDSKELYMGAVEGEFVDVLVRQKLDKNNMILDSSHTALMHTLRTTL